MAHRVPDATQPTVSDLADLWRDLDETLLLAVAGSGSGDG